MGLAGMTEETAEQKLKRHEDALAACMVEITRLREEMQSCARRRAMRSRC
jgi:hypothetical protein